MSSNVKKIKHDVLNVINTLITANESIISLIDKCDTNKFKETKKLITTDVLIEKIKTIDTLIEDTLSSHKYDDKDIKVIITYLKITTELARISNYTRVFVNKLEGVCKDIEKNSLKKLTIKMHKNSLKSLITLSSMVDQEDSSEIQDYLDDIILLESKTDDIYGLIQSELVKNNKKQNKCEINNDILNVLRKSEKISSRALTIAYLVIDI